MTPNVGICLYFERMQKLPSLAALSLTTDVKRNHDHTERRSVVARRNNFKKLASRNSFVFWDGNLNADGMPVGAGRLRYSKFVEGVPVIDSHPRFLFRWTDMAGLVMIDGKFSADGELDGICSVAWIDHVVAHEDEMPLANASPSRMDPNLRHWLSYSAECTYHNGTLISNNIKFGNSMHTNLYDLYQNKDFGVAPHDPMNVVHVQCIATVPERGTPLPSIMSGNMVIRTTTGTIHCNVFIPGLMAPNKFRNIVYSGALSTLMSRLSPWKYTREGYDIVAVESLPGLPKRGVVNYLNGDVYKGDYTLGIGRFGFGTHYRHTSKVTETGTYWGDKLSGTCSIRTTHGSSFSRVVTDVFMLGNRIGCPSTLFVSRDPENNYLCSKCVDSQEHNHHVLTLTTAVSGPIIDMFQTTDTTQLSIGRDVAFPCKESKSLRPIAIYDVFNPSQFDKYSTKRDTTRKILSCPVSRLECARTDRPFSAVNIPGGKLKDELNEKILFHGTSITNAINIIKNGFDLKFAPKSGMYGHGVYFADDVSKCDQYASPVTPDDLDEIGLPRVFKFDDTTIGADCGWDYGTEYYALLVCRVALKCVATVDNDSFQRNRTQSGEHFLAKHRFTEMNEMGKDDIFLHRWDSVVTHSENVSVSGKQYRYREFVVYDDTLAIPVHLVIYARATSRDPGTYQGSFILTDDDKTNDPYYCGRPGIFGF